MIFVQNFANECQSHWHKNLLPHIRYVATIPYESLRHKSNTFHTILALCTFILITFTETSIDETNKTQQKVRGSKFMFKISTIHVNTCIQTTTPVRNRWWFQWQCPILVAWHSGRTSVSDRRTFTVLRSTCSWRVTTYVGKLSAVGQPTRPTQPFILLGYINE